uniref:Uncharacterized protein n=1 Tax=Pavo cristatus TaxID=9049 RepID=A0A8C9G105_PAVCR
MDEVVVEYIRRTVLKIPRDEIMSVLQKWGFLSEAQLQTINFRQTKETSPVGIAPSCPSSRSIWTLLLDIWSHFG